MEKWKEFWETYKEYIRLDFLMYVFMFLAIIIFALVKFVF